MKAKRVHKLVLSKTTISHLDQDLLADVKGGVFHKDPGGETILEFTCNSCACTAYSCIGTCATLCISCIF